MWSGVVKCVKEGIVLYGVEEAHVQYGNPLGSRIKLIGKSCVGV